MKPADTIGCTFVNTVIGRGIFNHVINLSFGVFNFTPADDGKIDLDPVVACRLRMDKNCAVQLRDALNDLLTLVEEAEAKGATQPANDEKAEGLAPAKASETLN